jgi:hypothetical protein
VIPDILGELPDPWFGVGRVEDCGEYSCEHSMAMLLGMTGDVAAVSAALSGWTVCGGDVPNLQYLVALATGDVSPYLGWGHVTPSSWTCEAGGVGWPCFRPDAVPIVVHFSDAPFADGLTLCSPSRSHAQAIDALNAIGARYVGVDSGSGTYSAYADMAIIAEGTGSMHEDSLCVFRISSDGTGGVGPVYDAVTDFMRGNPVDVTYRLVDDPSDSVDAVSSFVRSVVPVTERWPVDIFDPSVLCEGGLIATDLEAPLDGTPDTFLDVPARTTFCFEVLAKRNGTVAAAGETRVYGCTLVALAGDGTEIGSREIRFVVPAAI